MFWTVAWYCRRCRSRACPASPPPPPGCLARSSECRRRGIFGKLCRHHCSQTPADNLICCHQLVRKYLECLFQHFDTLRLNNCSFHSRYEFLVVDFAIAVIVQVVQQGGKVLLGDDAHHLLPGQPAVPVRIQVLSVPHTILNFTAVEDVGKRNCRADEILFIS